MLIACGDSQCHHVSQQGTPMHGPSTWISGTPCERGGGAHCAAVMLTPVARNPIVDLHIVDINVWMTLCLHGCLQAPGNTLQRASTVIVCDDSRLCPHCWSTRTDYEMTMYTRIIWKKEMLSGATLSKRFINWVVGGTHDLLLQLRARNLSWLQLSDVVDYNYRMYSTWPLLATWMTNVLWSGSWDVRPVERWGIRPRKTLCRRMRRTVVPSIWQTPGCPTWPWRYLTTTRIPITPWIKDRYSFSRKTGKELNGVWRIPE